ncbi:hypothetical protein GIB67_007524 [Kingdonia uniflora]|uniref:DUF7054 domain-containing protein n=1 Tax=Kingdonia uniflora TaxID=39325 RepID=A0A7J7LWB3_9MAGN|nr:hypothetical protein GIB67_007524 [Kingdonia uniflora]
MPTMTTSRERKLLSERSSSFHGKAVVHAHAQLRRPKTDPDLLLSWRKVGSPKLEVSPQGPQRLTKLLLNVTIQRSLGAVHILMSPESTVGDLVAAAVRQYVKEARRPYLHSTDPLEFGLHYSSFSLESLDQEAKLIKLGSRNFFLCPMANVGGVTTTNTKVSSSSCSNQAEMASKTSAPWLKFINLFL